MKHKEISSHIAPIKNVSKRDAAQMLGICVRTIESLIYNREIDHVRIGSRVLIPYASIEYYNETHIIRAYDADSQKGKNRTPVYEQAKLLFFPQLYNAYSIRPRNYYDRNLAIKG